MCIFCERAKASLDDPLAFLDGGGDIGADASGGGRYGSSNTIDPTRSRSRAAVSLRQKREAERCEELKRRARLPVTVITGFLGAGKTTFVNHLLSARHGRRLAVIENEFGEVAVDDALLGDGVERGNEAQQVILMPNGCMCCRVRGDLVDALKRLIESTMGDEGQTPTAGASAGGGTADEADGVPGAADAAPSETANAVSSSGTKAVALDADAQVQVAAAKKEKPGQGKLDGVILECSGLDELAPVLQTFFADPFVQEHVRLDAVVCLCDSPRLLNILAAPPSAALSAPDAVEAVGESSASEPREEGKVGVAEEGGEKTGGSSAPLVMSQLALSDRVLLNKSDLITPAEGDALSDAVKVRFPGASVTRCERGKVDVGLVLGVDSFSLDKALEMDQHFADILADRPAGSEKHGHDHHAEAQEPKGAAHAKGVVSGHLHGHDRLGAQSVGVELVDRPMDWAKFMAWLKGFLDKEGEVIWRLKGVLWTSATGRGNDGTVAWGWGAGRRMVVQGLYGHFESEVSEWPAGATRRSRMVFIGDLSPRVQEALRTGVRSCLAAPRARPRPPAPPQRPQRSAYGTGSDGGAFASRLGSVKFGGADEHLFL